MPESTSSRDNRSPAFRSAQLQVLWATMFCYLFYYTGRQTFGFAIPGIEEELGVSKATLGWASAALLWSYAIGQSINGNLGDRFGGRRLMSLGAVLSCGLNWVVSFARSPWGLVIPWAANGYAQSMGWAPGSRVLSNWWGPQQRGKVYGAYVFAAGMSSVLAFATSVIILELNLTWRWIFRLPVLLLLVGAAAYYLIVRDHPQQRGFQGLGPEDGARTTTVDDDPALPIDETSGERYRQVLSNRAFLIASVAIGFQSMARYGLLIWAPVHFLGEDWKSSETKWVSIALPIGMALGALASGWLSDNCFRANRSRVIGLFLLLATGSSLVMHALPRDHPLVIAALLATGFFVYGPQSAFWALCPDLLSPQRAGTGTGVMNTFAYVFAGLGEPLIGAVIDQSGDTAVVFLLVAVCCLLGSIMSLGIRR